MHGCIVYTEPAPRRQQFHVAPAMLQPNSAVSTPLRWIFKTRYKKQPNQTPTFRVQELWESRGGRPGLSVMSLICQPTSEDMKLCITIIIIIIPTDHRRPPLTATTQTNIPSDDRDNDAAPTKSRQRATTHGTARHDTTRHSTAQHGTAGR